MPQPNTNVETGRVSSWRHHLLYYWIATGIVVGYAFSAVMTIGGLNIHELNIIYITTVFIPANILLHALTHFLWHRPRARNRFLPLTRGIMSCVTIEIWAAGCVGVFYTMDNAMWIAGWWFIGIPGGLLIINRVVEYGIEWRLGWQGN
ncbi:hypothetical protein GT037_006200 [Alternaria burnsii]|uniref:Uncharacterized protein n=1 Tax=Alternaria burnsii TaxID=1187904 RepID=A0A8H7EF59_9PLEO|nr:uncharacterized protein GT037_006200 [Alternaria burnsii]KAF7675481.1 hypothetical protein GT037_006200 [Alternaria burnsii]